ncbi:hypothetical protein BDV09DRAFT_199847 [Aspergillus tetrazonus]
MYTQHVSATEHEQTSAPQRAIWVLDLNSARSWLIPDTQSARYPQWLGHCDQVTWLEACTNGHTRFVVADRRLRSDRYVAGSVAGPVWDLRTTGVVNMADPGDDTDHDLGFVVVGQVDEGGRLFNPFQDQSPGVILFTARDPELDEATHIAGSCYICPMLDWNGLIIPDDYYKAFRHRGLGGACSSPAVSRGGSVAFLAQKHDGYAADKNRVLIVTDKQKGTYKEIFASADGKGQWDMSPFGVSFVVDGTLLLYVEEQGQRVLFQLSQAVEATPADLKRIEPVHTRAKSVLDATPLGMEPSKVLLTCESFVHGQQFILHDLVSGSIRDFPLDNHRFGLTDTQIDEVWFPSANGRRIHAWIIRPSFFNPDHKYPLAYFIHDDQHGSWSSGWNITAA